MRLMKHNLPSSHLVLLLRLKQHRRTAVVSIGEKPDVCHGVHEAVPIYAFNLKVVEDSFLLGNIKVKISKARLVTMAAFGILLLGA